MRLVTWPLLAWESTLYNICVISTNGSFFVKIMVPKPPQKTNKKQFRRLKEPLWYMSGYKTYCAFCFRELSQDILYCAFCFRELPQDILCILFQRATTRHTMHSVSESYHKTYCAFCFRELPQNILCIPFQRATTRHTVHSVSESYHKTHCAFCFRELPQDILCILCRRATACPHVLSTCTGGRQ